MSPSSNLEATLLAKTSIDLGSLLELSFDFELDPGVGGAGPWPGWSWTLAWVELDPGVVESVSLSIC